MFSRGGGSENCFLLGLPLQYVLTCWSLFFMGFPTLYQDRNRAFFVQSALPGRALVHARAPLISTWHASTACNVEPEKARRDERHVSWMALLKNWKEPSDRYWYDMIYTTLSVAYNPKIYGCINRVITPTAAPSTEKLVQRNPIATLDALACLWLLRSLVLVSRSFNN